MRTSYREKHANDQITSGLTRSGTSDELMEAAGISVSRAAAARELVKDSSNGGS